MNNPRDRRGPKVAETVALEIVRDIAERGLDPGDRLPREADMLQQYQVSRSSLREALRLLEAQGLIHLKPGPSGGPVVNQADPDSLARSLRLHLHLQGATYGDLLAAWQITDPILAEMAAANPDREAVRAAMEPHLSDAARGDMRAIGEQFHTAVAKLSGNVALSFSLRALTHVMENHVVEAVRELDFDDEIAHEHHKVAAAIIAGDAKKARRLMDAHVRDMVAHFNEYLPRVVGERVSLS